MAEENDVVNMEPKEGEEAVVNMNPENAQPKIAKVNIGGAEFEVDVGLAAAIEAMNRSVKEQFDSLKATSVKAEPAKPATQTEAYDYSVGIFTEPDVALGKLREEIKAEIRNEYNAVESQKTFWTTFYKDNSDLKDVDFLVESVLSKNYASLKEKSVEDAAADLAKLTRASLAKLGKQTNKENKEENRTTIEGGSNPIVKNPSQNKDNVVSSLSSIISKRQAEKRKAAAS